MNIGDLGLLDFSTVLSHIMTMHSLTQLGIKSTDIWTKVFSQVLISTIYIMLTLKW